MAPEYVSKTSYIAPEVEKRLPVGGLRLHTFQIASWSIVARISLPGRDPLLNALRADDLKTQG